MTEQRKEWLIKEGIITTSTAAAAASSQQLSIVLIPANDKNEPQEFFLDAAHAPQLDTHLLPYFQMQQDVESVDMEMIKAQVLPAMERGCDGGMCPHISLSTLRASAEEGNIQAYAWADGEDSSSTLRMYYDESAHLKHRPINTKAMNYIIQKSSSDADAGAKDEPVPTIHGDVFVVRVQKSSNEESRPAEGVKYHSLKVTDVMQSLSSTNTKF